MDEHAAKAARVSVEHAKAAYAHWLDYYRPSDNPAGGELAGALYHVIRALEALTSEESE